MERLYSVGPVHLSLEGVLCHRREQRRRHRDRKGRARRGRCETRGKGRNANRGGDGDSYIPVSSRGTDGKKSRRGARSTFFTGKNPR